jgi:peptidyl-prolyl cis-trans isomerase C
MKRLSRKKNSTKIFILATGVVALIFAASTYFLNQENDIVVAQINDQKIFKSEIDGKLRNAFDGQNFNEQGQEINIPKIENLPKEVIELLAKEVYLDKELAKKARKSKISENKEIKNKIVDAKNKILRQAFVDSLVKQEITDQKISEKYVELSNELAGKKEYLASHIVTKTKEDAQKILKELKSKGSANFPELAKKYSIDQDSAANGGHLGYLLEDNMMKEIADVIVNLKKDEISDPIQTKFGWHIIKIFDVRDAKALPFESAKDNIRNQLAQDKLNEINSKIIKDAKIKILIELKEPDAVGKAREIQPEQVKNEGEAAEKKSDENQKGDK